MDIVIPTYVLNKIDALESAGFEAYVVGGCVRDFLLGVQPNDWDMCTSARPDDMRRVFSDFELIDIGADHGTIAVVDEGAVVEITTYRGESGYSDSRHPDEVVFLDDVSADLARRDFTINAMAYHPVRGLVDPYGGRGDLEAKLVRCVGCAAERFDEDALRIMRALRFSAALSFPLEAETEKAVFEGHGRLSEIAAERVSVELKKLLVGPSAVEVLRRYRAIIATVLPLLSMEFDFDQHNFHHVYDVWEHTLHALGAAPLDPTIRLAVLLHDIGKPPTFHRDRNGIGHFYYHSYVGEPLARECCRVLRLSREETETICYLVLYHMFQIPDTPKRMRRFITLHGPERACMLFDMRRCDVAGKGNPDDDDAELTSAFARACILLEETVDTWDVLGVTDLEIGGREIIALGVKPGPLVGECLNTLLDRVIEGDLPNDGDALLQAAQELID